MRRVFTNPLPLTQKEAESLQTLPLDSFPTITDFAVELQATPRFGSHLNFVSRSHGYLISFPWWDHMERDLRAGTRNAIPLGTKERPFYDLEQGWQVIIFIEGKYVYLLQGGDAGDRRAVFHTWLRVPRESYVTAWDQLLMQCNPDYTPGTLADFWTYWKKARAHGQHPRGAVSSFTVRKR